MKMYYCISKEDAMVLPLNDNSKLWFKKNCCFAHMAAAPHGEFLNWTTEKSEKTEKKKSENEWLKCKNLIENKSQHSIILRLKNVILKVF